MVWNMFSSSCCSWITLTWMKQWRVMTVPLRSGMNGRTLWENTLYRPELLPSRTPGWETSESCSSDTACLRGVSVSILCFTSLHLVLLRLFFSIYLHYINTHHHHSMFLVMVKLFFSGAPDFDEILANCTAELGQTVKLACKVTGVPKPVVTWYKGKTSAECFLIICAAGKSTPIDYSFVVSSLHWFTCWVQMGAQWRQILITSLLRTLTVRARWFWIIWLQMILVSTCALPRAQLAMPVLLEKLLFKVSYPSTVIVDIFIWLLSVIFSLVFFWGIKIILIKNRSLFFCFTECHFSTLFLWITTHLNVFLAVPPRFVNKMRNAVFVAGEDAQFTCVIQSAPNPKIRYSFTSII